MGYGAGYQPLLISNGPKPAYSAAITGNVDQPGADALWVPPEKVRQKSPFLNHEVVGAHFLPPEKRARAINGGKYPLNPMVQPPAFWRSIIDAEPYRIRAFWIVGSTRC